MNTDENRIVKNGFSNIIKNLSQSAKVLINIKFKQCNFDEEECQNIGDLLENCSKIEKINLNGNKRMNNGFENICKGLVQSSITLKYINIANCNLNEEQCRCMGTFLKTCSSIESINLNGNEDMGNGFEKICEGLLQSSNTLKCIMIGLCELDYGQYRQLGNLLKSCHKIETISLEGNGETGNELSSIFKGLIQSSNSLININMSWCDLNEKQCKQIGSFLKNCSKIEKINMAGNDFMRNGLTDICKGLLQSSRTLKNINFGFCDLRDKQSTEIGKLLKSCSNIETIILEWNRQMGTGLSKICEGLMQLSHNLKDINLGACSLSEQQFEIIGQLIIKCYNLESLNLKGNEDIGKGLSNICQGLRQSKNTLKNVNFASWYLNEKEYGKTKNMIKTSLKLS